MGKNTLDCFMGCHLVGAARFVLSSFVFETLVWVFYYLVEY